MQARAKEAEVEKKNAQRAAFSVEEFSVALGVSKDHTRRRIAAGDVKSVRFGRRLLIPASELARILE